MICEIQNQRQDNYCAYFDHTRLFPLRGSAESEIIPLDAGLRVDGMQGSSIWRMSWKHNPVSQPRETLSVTPAKESLRLIHVLTIWQRSAQLFQQVTLNPIHMINKGRSPNLRHVTRTHRVDLWVNFGSFFFFERTFDQLSDILTKGMFTTMQIHSFLTLWQTFLLLSNVSGEDTSR